MSALPRPIDHLYVLCDPVREPDRASFLTRWLGSTGLCAGKDYTMMCACYGDTLTADDAWRAYNPWNPRRPGTRSHNSYNMKLGEISLCINWATVAAAAVRAGHKVVMIWESDVLPDSDFMTKLEAVLGILDSKHGTDWDYLSISAGANLRPSRPAAAPGGVLDYDWFPVRNYFHTRTTDAMIVRTDILAKILRTFFPVAEVLDWELNYQLSLHNSRSLWLDPPIIRQGSGSVYATTL